MHLKFKLHTILVFLKFSFLFSLYQSEGFVTFFFFIVRGETMTQNYVSVNYSVTESRFW